MDLENGPHFQEAEAGWAGDRAEIPIAGKFPSTTAVGISGFTAFGSPGQGEEAVYEEGEPKAQIQAG